MIATLQVKETHYMPESTDHQVHRLTVLSITGRLDASTVNVLDRALVRSFATGTRTAVLDMGEVTYISSSGLRVLLTARRTAREKGGDIVLCALSSNVRDVMDMVGFTALFTIKDSVGLAVGTAKLQTQTQPPANSAG